MKDNSTETKSRCNKLELALELACKELALNTRSQYQEDLEELTKMYISRCKEKAEAMEDRNNG